MFFGFLLLVSWLYVVFMLIFLGFKFIELVSFVKGVVIEVLLCIKIGYMKVVDYFRYSLFYVFYFFYLFWFIDILVVKYVYVD